MLVVGLGMSVLLPAALVWGWDSFAYPNTVRVTTLWTLFLVFLAIALLLHKLSHVALASGGTMAYILPVVSIVFLLAFAALLFLRSRYSRPVLLLSYVFTLAWCYTSHMISRRYQRLKLAALPMTDGSHLYSTPQADIRQLDKPDLDGVRYDGIVADLQGAGMTPAWESFLAQCILANIPVFHVRQIRESLTGRVRIDHLSENAAGALIPSPIYMGVKRMIDLAGVLLTLPLSLPLMALVALAIRVDSRGPVIFRQRRVGRGNQDFLIYKFRTMRCETRRQSPRETADGDPRITRLGHFLRRSRLDELPQVFNILKGDMSLIGPRPEMREFIDKYYDLIPFYIYRHVLKPGITGWAQVNQGATNSVAQARIKLQYDFYYIKHVSLWLDILITLKTVKIVLTGWGAR